MHPGGCLYVESDDEEFVEKSMEEMLGSLAERIKRSLLQIDADDVEDEYSYVVQSLTAPRVLRMAEALQHSYNIVPMDCCVLSCWIYEADILQTHLILIRDFLPCLRPVVRPHKLLAFPDSEIFSSTHKGFAQLADVSGERWRSWSRDCQDAYALLEDYMRAARGLRYVIELLYG